MHTDTTLEAERMEGEKKVHIDWDKVDMYEKLSKEVCSQRNIIELKTYLEKYQVFLESNVEEDIVNSDILFKSFLFVIADAFVSKVDLDGKLKVNIRTQLNTSELDEIERLSALIQPYPLFEFGSSDFIKEQKQGEVVVPASLTVVIKINRKTIDIAREKEKQFIQNHLSNEDNFLELIRQSEENAKRDRTS